MSRRKVGILIAGFGPCGIGAALELEENGKGGKDDYLVVDPSRVVGGWASSRETPEGFTFDFGGHVLFPHKYYPKFAELLDSLPIDWVASVPKRGVSLDGRFLPYPAQRNLQRLSAGKLVMALGSLALRRLRQTAGPGTENTIGPDLESYLLRQFGQYLTDVLMGPLNSKMWAHGTFALANGWVTLRSGSSQRNVPDVSLRQTVRNLVSGQDSPGWTSDTRVTYPARGGSGAIWKAIAAGVPKEKVMLGIGLRSISLEERVATLANGEEVEYGSLISSMPLDRLLRSMVGRPELHAQAERFVCARSRLFGFGVEGRLPAKFEGLHSFHVPDADVPFWRVTFPSNMSLGNVPADRAGSCYSVLCEISEPAGEPAQEKAALELRVERGLAKLGILGRGADGVSRIVSRFHETIEHGYPVPFLGRDALLGEAHGVLEPAGVYSRGRFGAWKYEISNQDHAFMQGVEVVRRILFGVAEVTYRDPQQVNEVVVEAREFARSEGLREGLRTAGLAVQAGAPFGA